MYGQYGYLVRETSRFIAYYKCLDVCGIQTPKSSKYPQILRDGGGGGGVTSEYQSTHPLLIALRCLVSSL